MRLSFKTGFSFGLTSGIITTLGLMVGLHAGTHSRIAVIGGILTIAIADSLSDALGIHLSQESQNQYSGRSIWEATIATFLAKFAFSLTFVIPLLFFELLQAVWISVFWGFLILAFFSFLVAKQKKEKPERVIGEHLLIAFVVILVSCFVGNWLAKVFS